MLVFIAQSWYVILFDSFLDFFMTEILFYERHSIQTWNIVTNLLEASIRWGYLHKVGLRHLRYSI